MAPEGPQGFRTAVVLNALGVNSRHCLGDAQCEKEVLHQFVTTAAVLGQLDSFRGQKNGTVRPRGHVTVTLKAGHGANDRDV